MSTLTPRPLCPPSHWERTMLSRRVRPRASSSWRGKQLRYLITLNELSCPFSSNCSCNNASVFRDHKAIHRAASLLSHLPSWNFWLFFPSHQNAIHPLMFRSSSVSSVKCIFWPSLTPSPPKLFQQLSSAAAPPPITQPVQGVTKLLGWVLIATKNTILYQPSNSINSIKIKFTQIHPLLVEHASDNQRKLRLCG